MAPLVSVIVAARDAERTIDGAVRSVLAQVLDDLELIVVDDGSVDRTSAVLSGITDPRLKTLRLESSVGRGAARNLAAAHAEGRYLAVQDADDISLPQRLSLTAALAAADDRVVVVSGQALAQAPRLGQWRVQRYPTCDEAIRRSLDVGVMSVCHQAALIRRDAFEAVGGYDVHCVRAQDLNLMIRLLPTGRFAAVAQDVLVYRHPVVLPFSFWWHSRRFTYKAIASARAGSSDRAALPARDDARMLESLLYVPAMVRRLGRYARCAV